MAEIIERLADFPGFAVQYELSANPFFKPIVVENLRQISKVETGKRLLKEIAAANPRSRGDFPPSVNVMIKPHGRVLVQSGYKMTYSPGSAKKDMMVKSAAKAHSPEGCPFYKVGGSFAQAVDQTNTGNGSGTVSIMNFTNAPAKTSKGETMYPFVTLAHELIHCLHHVTGTRKDHGEEQWTTGIGEYSDEPMSENAIRNELNLPPRLAY